MKKMPKAELTIYGTFTTLMLLGLVCLPTLAGEPTDADGEKSSRKVKTSQIAKPKNSEPSTKPNKPAVIEIGSKPVPAKLDHGKSDNSVAPAALKPASLDDQPLELSVEDQQSKDQGECPGAEGSKVPVTQNVNDIPLDQEEHPFDAPAAETDESPMPEDETEILVPVRPKTGEPKSTAVKPNGIKLELEPKPVLKSEPKSKGDPARSQVDNQLESRINSCLAHYFINQESLTKRSPWAVMHTILPFGVETDIIAGSRPVNAIGWMCYNGVCKSQRVFQSTQSGFRTNVGPGVQGHEGQFLAVLAQSSVPRSFPIIVGKTRYSVSDLIRYEMTTCKEKSELTFKLIGLSHYLSPGQAWRDERGHTWNLEKLVREELDQPVVGAACGGTHRLMGLSYALMMRRRYQQPINGHWARADVYLQDFVKYAWTLQNPDGSFSTDWFEGRANEPNMERKVQTTGHILEWLIFTLPAEDLDDPRISKSIEFLISQIYDHRDKDWPIGPRGHSLRAISLYNQRVFGAPTGQLKKHLAQTGYMNVAR